MPVLLAISVPPNSLKVQPQDLFSLRPRGGRSAFVLALGLGLGDALTLSLQHNLPFKLCHAPEKGQHQLARSGPRVDAHRQDAKACAFGGECVEDFQQVRHRAR